jgi:hypothetical protein
MADTKQLESLSVCSRHCLKQFDRMDSGYAWPSPRYLGSSLTLKAPDSHQKTSSTLTSNSGFVGGYSHNFRTVEKPESMLQRKKPLLASLTSSPAKFLLIGSYSLLSKQRLAFDHLSRGRQDQVEEVKNLCLGTSSFLQ